MKFKFLTAFSILFMLFLFFMPFTYLSAANGGDDCSTLICNPLNSGSFEEFMTSLIRTFTVFAAPILALMVALAGFQYMASGSNPGNRQKATNTLKYAAIGFMVIISAWIITFVLKGIF